MKNINSIGGILISNIKLKVTNLSKTFDNNEEKLCVLNNISFDVFENEFLTIVGPSGCGKTTLLRIISGLLKPSSGKIFFDGQIITKASSLIGYVPQEYSLFPWKSLKNNIKFGLKIKNYKPDEIENKINSLLDMMNLSKFKDYYPKDISGGMRQKVAIARSLAIDQKLILLDEPLRSIDAQNRNKLQDDIINIWKMSKRTIIFVTHNIDEAVYISDRIIVLSSLPGTIKKIIDINLDRPRDRTNQAFNSVRREILEELD
ncbi:MAG: ABC transporter ATP-binding protein [Candidatus Lokiarchaeota archaeon]|nr:ABC transporter ATP-binding protein [Candidatus Lokiarchaeota archaeon]